MDGRLERLAFEVQHGNSGETALSIAASSTHRK
jgi:hypothetical protein